MHVLSFLPSSPSLHPPCHCIRPITASSPSLHLPHHCICPRHCILPITALSPITASSPSLLCPLSLIPPHHCILLITASSPSLHPPRHCILLITASCPSSLLPPLSLHPQLSWKQYLEKPRAEHSPHTCSVHFPVSSWLAVLLPPGSRHCGSLPFGFLGPAQHPAYTGTKCIFE